MEIGCANRFGKSRTETVEKIKDERLFDLNLFLRAFERPDPAQLKKPCRQPSEKTRDEQPEKK
jgi:hypothetical protein